MFSGKTTHSLFRIYKHNQIAEIPTLVINHTDDVNSYSEILIYPPMMAVEIPCIKVSKLDQIYSLSITMV